MTRPRLALAILVATLVLTPAAAALPTPPSSPHLHWVYGSVTVYPGVDFYAGWDPSTFDPDATARFYEVRVTKYRTGTTPTDVHTTTATFSCSYAIPLVPGYHYVVSVRAGEKLVGPFDIPSYYWSHWSTMQFDAVSLPVADF